MRQADHLFRGVLPCVCVCVCVVSVSVSVSVSVYDLET